MKKTPEQKLFDLVEKIGECLDGDLHVIDNTEYPTADDGERKYRVYHKDGYCWDIEKEAVHEEEYGNVIYAYHFLEEWEGFKKANGVEEVIKIIVKSWAG